MVVPKCWQIVDGHLASLARFAWHGGLDGNDKIPGIAMYRRLVNSEQLDI